MTAATAQRIVHTVADAVHRGTALHSPGEADRLIGMLDDCIQSGFRYTSVAADGRRVTADGLRERLLVMVAGQ